MDALDTSLEILARWDHPVLSTHGPMAAEALVDLGFGDRAPEWAGDYRKTMLSEQLPDAPPLPLSEWRSALGSQAQRAAWTSRFEAELDAASWQEVARAWLPRLVPGLSADATHGLIRTAHALRSLGGAETTPRLRELAEALGSWASTYEEMPGTRAGGKPFRPTEAIGSVPFVPLAEQSWDGLITERLRSLNGLPGFAPAITRVEPGADLGGFADDLAVLAARLYLANAGRARVIDFIHAVDGVYAVRELVPFLDEANARAALWYGWQAVAGLHAYGGGAPLPEDLEAPSADECPALVARAVEVGGAHAIKFAQACVGEYALRPDPVFHAALADMVVRMEEAKEKLGMVI